MASSQAEARTAPRPRERRVALERALSPAHLALAAILALSAVLNTVRLGQNAWGNTFYSAGVKSMLASFHNFFFASFDAGGLVTIDKPPLAVWAQALSAKLFGFTPLSLLLPEAVIGVLTVALLYFILVRRLGVPAALVGALSLAVFPIFVAVSRDNGVDPLLVLLMLSACGAALRSIEGGRLRWLLISGALIGLAFNTKTLAAYLAVPAIALGYLVCAPGAWWRRLLALVAAGAAMAIVSFAWIAVVELTPASQRPYVGSSTNNTELGLTFEYNGLGRVEGEAGGPGNIAVKAGGLVAAPTHTGARPPRHAHPYKPAKLSEFLSNGRLRYPIAFGGAVGPLRLFGSALSGQGAWTLPLAIFGLIALVLQVLVPERRHGRQLPQPAHGERGERASQRSPWRRDPRLAVLLVLGGWFFVEYVVLSYSKGIVHPYYISALAPGAAAMIGAGVAASIGWARPTGDRRGARSASDPRVLLVPVAVAATVAAQVAIVKEQHYMQWLIPLLIAGAAVLTVLLLAFRRLALPVVLGLLALLLIGPTGYAATTWLAPAQGTFPAAGPHEATGIGKYGLEPKQMSETAKLVAYAAGHRATSRWSLLADSSPTAAPMILLGSPAGALGGYGGSDPVLDGRSLARLIARGQARYVVLGGEYAERGGNAATAAVLHDCPQVPHQAWHGPVPGPTVLVLFDCAGRERALRAHPRG
ncbi:MAG TPA: glycosyltransferase family 39 protein [Solirubrobacteraceae bacterium]|nr:glycosyltransferase family 39 protein [Solirubrobacteraceae bacterium]